MNIKNVRSKNLRENYFSFKHPSGLTIYVYPQSNYHTTYALLGTMYGSINTSFKANGKLISVPDGIAHYLEHKMFESEDGDAFLKYSKTGASANAYTSFNSTCYLFSCTENFKESLKILLELVQTPYFTKENVEKERGIIAQEIKMYEDDPEWAVSLNLLKAMYKNHPVNIDIAGSVESIADITAEKLFDCYNAYYNLHNMALAVVGNVNIDDVIDIADEYLQPVSPVKIENIFKDEPENIVKNKIVTHLPTSIPLFELGFKEKCFSSRVTNKELALTHILLEAVSGKASGLFEELVNKQLVSDAGFYSEFFEGPNYKSTLFSAQSENPEAAAEIILNQLNKIKQNGINELTFESAKKATYGKAISMLNNNPAVASSIINGHFANRELFDYINCILYASKEDLNKILSLKFNPDFSSLSIVKN